MDYPYEVQACRRQITPKTLLGQSQGMFSATSDNRSRWGSLPTFLLLVKTLYIQNCSIAQANELKIDCRNKIDSLGVTTKRRLRLPSVTDSHSVS